jgi:outer membrane protein OmpA-like peptidoglycan-associated protein
MTQQDTSAEKTALGLVWLLIAVVVAAVVAFGASKALGHNTAQGAKGPQVERIYFGVGDDSLPIESSEPLQRVTDAARANSSVQVLISGFHDASGNAAANETLARQRAERVRHALEANGVPANQLVLDKPAATQGGVDPKEARRVEVRLK